VNDHVTHEDTAQTACQISMGQIGKWQCRNFGILFKACGHIPVFLVLLSCAV
jgi:hypothetical protein